MPKHKTHKEETPPAAAAFLEYCYLGPDRSLVKLCEALKAKRQQSDSVPTVRQRTLYEWSVKYSWQQRVKAYDEQQITKAAKARLKKLEEEVDAMNARQAMIGTTQQSKALKQIEALIEAKKFGSVASVSLLKLAIDVEREARGASVSRIELTGANGGPVETSGIAIYLPQKDEEK